MTLLTRTIVASVAVLATACGASAATPQATAAELAAADVVITTDAMRYVDPPNAIDAGVVTIGLDNLDSAPHDVTFEGGLGTVVAAARGSADVAEVTLEPGTYVVYCAVGGHRQAGMEFGLEVR